MLSIAATPYYSVKPTDQPSAELTPIQIDVVLESRDILVGSVLEYLSPSGALLLANTALSAMVSPVLAIFAGAVDAAGFAVVFAGTYLFCAACSCLVALLIQVFRLRKQEWRQGRVGVHTLVFTASGMTERTPYNESHVAWQEVNSVTKALGYLRIRYGKQYFPVPIRALPAQFPASRLLSILRQWHRAGTTKQAGRRWRKRLAWFAGVGFAVLCIVFSYALSMEFHRMLKTFDTLNQHANWYNITSQLRPRIEDFRQTHGRLPQTLDEISNNLVKNDSFQRPFHYETRGDTYILASFGRDGVRDHADYWPIREMPLIEGDALRRGPQSVCRKLDADTVFSDRGAHFACFAK
ncbi:MAG: hypothetical protein IPG34_15560 [Rhodocyclaceae bacterium]|nr:hypothetical protein [Rhodocyclaceae bacterium]